MGFGVWGNQMNELIFGVLFGCCCVVFVKPAVRKGKVPSTEMPLRTTPLRSRKLLSWLCVTESAVSPDASILDCAYATALPVLMRVLAVSAH